MLTGAAVLSLLLLGIAPAITAVSTTSTTSTTTTTQAPSPAAINAASVLIQMAQAAHDYANNLLTIAAAQQPPIDLTQASNLIAQGDQSLAQAKGELNSNPSLAVQDALKAMRDYKEAAQYLQSKVVESVKDSYQAERLQNAIQRAEEKVTDLQSIVTKACNTSTAPNAPQDICTDATTSLTSAMSDLQQASTMAPTDPSGAAKLLGDAAKLIGKAHADIDKLADARKTEKAIDYIQNKLDKRIADVQAMVQKANLSPDLLAKVQGQLTQAQTLADQALQDIKSGNFSTGAHEAQQSMQLLQQIVSEIRQASRP
jgi:hypothetical protein